MKLSAYIAAEVESGVKAATVDRDAFETESSVKIFQKAFDWMKYLAVTIATVIGLGLAYTGFKVNDLRGSSEAAKDSFTRQSNDAVGAIIASSGKALAGINDAAKQASDASKASAKLADSARNDAGKAKADIQASADTVRETARQGQVAVEDALKLRPEIDQLRGQLSTTEADLERQKKLLSSSSKFAKEIFSSYQSNWTSFDDPKRALPALMPVSVGSGYIVRAGADTGSLDPKAQVSRFEPRITLLYILLPAIPIESTVRVRIGIIEAPPSSFVMCGNVIILLWGSPADALRDARIVVNYFPDTDEQFAVANTMTVKEDQIFADDQPLPMYTEKDKKRFVGNRWITVFSYDDKNGEYRTAPLVLTK